MDMDNSVVIVGEEGTRGTNGDGKKYNKKKKKKIGDWLITLLLGKQRH